MNSDESTTVFVTARPTPAVPPVTRMPKKHATRPIMNPKTIVLNVGGRKSLKATCFKPESRNRGREIGSASVFAMATSLSTATGRGFAPKGCFPRSVWKLDWNAPHPGTSHAPLDVSGARVDRRTS